MKTLIAGLLAFLLLAGPAAAQNYGSNYDWRSGNSYSWQRDSTGTTRIQGHNINNGSMWSQSIDRRGNQQGWDSQGNAWSYDNNTGTYINYGTGRICSGSGALRTCY
ncbi:hypothetical protein [Thioalkalivibrio thiocyanodenitrificans]|uniref:hypothetical protein n=1 Tax=Thioalkalivibrio thiocyanodenitrificans TaxID=243063 RepID=UPI00036DC1E1|nr:hypothetical protein [Thioalkalivibrio thiocyanodenitrificans]